MENKDVRLEGLLIARNSFQKIINTAKLYPEEKSAVILLDKGEKSLEEVEKFISGILSLENRE